MSNLWKNALATVSVCLALASWSAEAEEAKPRVSILTEQGGVLVDAGPNPTLAPSAQFRIAIDAPADGAYTITIDTDDAPKQFEQAVDVRAGSATILPSAESWFKAPAEEKIVTITLSGPARETASIVVASSAQLDAMPDAAQGTVMGDGGALTAPVIPAAGELDLAAIVRSASESAKVKPGKTIDLRGDESQLYARLAPSIVAVFRPDGLGSGVIVDYAGHIVTNYHVVEGVNDVVVQFKPAAGLDISGTRMIRAKVIATDPGRDLALLELVHTYGLPPSVIMADPAEVKIGMDVHAIGHPEGNFWSYTRGVVSQLHSGYRWNKHKADVIQTQTPINFGNSGGALLASNGKLVGINSFGSSNYAAPGVSVATGINFAISVSDVKRFVDEALMGGSANVAASDAPKPPRLGRGLDLKKNGKVDAYELDQNGNGVVDGYAMDQDEDGQIEAYLIDSNEDGKTDQEVVYRPLQDGTIVAATQYDTDGDGKVDMRAIDRNFDGNIDWYEAVAQTS